MLPPHDSLRRFRRPRLAEDLAALFMPDGLGVQVRGGPATVVFRGGHAEAALAYLFQRLDGNRALEDVLAERPPEIPDATLLRTLRLLDLKGLLAEGAPGEGHAPTDAPDPVLARQLLFFGRKLALTRRHRSAAEVQRRLEQAHVVLVATGLFGAATYDLLTRSGVRSVEVVAWDDDGLVSEAVEASACAPRALVRPESTSVDGAAAQVRAWADGADLLLTATRHGPQDLFAALNRIALERCCPWLRADEGASELEVGPYVHPYESSCYTCMRLRATSASERAVEELVYQEALAHVRPAGETRPAGESLAGATLGASLVVLEAIRILTRAARPRALDAVLSVSPLDGEIVTHRILRVPRCPDCYRQSARRESDG